MELVKLSTGEIGTIGDLRVAFPNTGFPRDLTGVDLTEFDAAVVEPTDPPATESGEVAERDGIENVGGLWQWKWLVRSASPEEFADHEARLHRIIDNDAGDFRTRFITDVPGQQQTYAEKEKEARAWTVESDPADFPFLSAEAAARGVTIAEVAALVIATADAWRNLGAAIEGARMGAKAGVSAARAAVDWAAMDAAADVDWEALLIP